MSEVDKYIDEEIKLDIVNDTIGPEKNNFGVTSSYYFYTFNNDYKYKDSNGSERKIIRLPYYSSSYFLGTDDWSKVKAGTLAPNAYWSLPVLSNKYIVYRNNTPYNFSGIKLGSLPSFRAIYGYGGQVYNSSVKDYVDGLKKDDKWQGEAKYSTSIVILLEQNNLKVGVGNINLSNGAFDTSSGYTWKTYTASDFAGGHLPDRLFVLIQAGGGGGASGGVVVGNDGQGGASGCCALVCLYLAEMWTLDKKSPQGHIFNGFCILMGAGGNEQPNAGKDGDNGGYSYVYSMGKGNSEPHKEHLVGGWQILPGGGGKYNKGTATVVGYNDSDTINNAYKYSYWQSWNSPPYSSVIWSITGKSCGTQNPQAFGWTLISPYSDKNIFGVPPDNAYMYIGNKSKGSNGDGSSSGGGSASAFGNGGNAGIAGDIKGKAGGLGAGGGGGRYVVAGHPDGGAGGAGFAIIFY